MIRPKYELLADQVWPVLLNEGHDCQELLARHTVLSLRPGQQSAPICNDSLSSFTVDLGEDPSITSVGVQYERLGKVGACQDR